MYQSESSYAVAFKKFWCHFCSKESQQRIEGTQLNQEQFCSHCGCALEQVVSKENHPRQFQIYRPQPPRIFYHIIFFNFPEEENHGATEQQIQNMRREIHSGELEKTCYICQEDFHNGEQIALMNCQHGFHEECIGKWLRMNNSCPVCRSKQN